MKFLLEYFTLFISLSSFHCYGNLSLFALVFQVYEEKDVLDAPEEPQS